MIAHTSGQHARTTTPSNSALLRLMTGLLERLRPAELSRRGGAGRGATRRERTLARRKQRELMRAVRAFTG